MSNVPCCRLDQEFICGIVRNRSGIDSGELDYSIRVERAEKDLDNVIREVERMLEQLRSRQSRTDTAVEHPDERQCAACFTTWIGKVSQCPECGVDQVGYWKQKYLEARKSGYQEGLEEGKESRPVSQPDIPTINRAAVAWCNRKDIGGTEYRHSHPEVIFEAGAKWALARTQHDNQLTKEGKK